jgi:N-acetylmuramoyl-L-alanine amidase
MRKVKIIFLNKMSVAFAALIITALLIVPIVLCIELSSKDTFIDPKSGIIVVDPGHGGIDGGASKEGVLEKEINLDISKKLKSILEQKGYTIIMTREEDVSLDYLDNSKKSRHQRDLNARANIINKSNGQLFISVHVNCNLKRPSTAGTIVFYDDKYEQSKTLADSLQKELNQMEMSGKKRTEHSPARGEYFVLSKTNIPGVIVETAFISNKAELQEITKDPFRLEIAKAIAKGVEQYLSDSRKVSSPAASSSQ